MKRTWMIVLGCALGASAYSSTAHADGVTSTAAQRLFDEARELAEHDRWTEACPRLAESLRLEPNMTTEFRLADCYERIGRIASAWIHYTAAAQAAQVAGETSKSRVAIERAARLEPRVDRLLIAPPAMPDIQIERDGRILPREAWNTPQPVDPGEHTVHVTAPGKTSFDALVTLTGTGQIRRVDIPVLEQAPSWRLASEAPRFFTEPARPDAELLPPQPRRDSALRVLGWGVFGAGSASVVTGFALYAAEATSSNPCASSKCVPSVTLLGAGALAVLAGTIMVLASQ
jgi:hypothetical protein